MSHIIPSLNKSNKVLRIVIFGPESTGKTTLCQKLASHFQTIWNPEYIRGYLDKKQLIRKYGRLDGPLVEWGDIEPVLIGQMVTEDQVFEQGRDVVFYDTNLLTNQIYTYHYFGKTPDWLEKALEARVYDFYLLMDIDVPWVPDYQRENPQKRKEMFLTMQKELLKRKIPYILISGDYDNRFQLSRGIVEKLIEETII